VWKLLVKNRKQACWIRVLVVSWWSTEGTRGWSAWGYHFWKVNSSNRFWERNMIFSVRTIGKLKINQPVVWCSCTSQIRYSPSYKNSTPCGQTAGGDRAPRICVYIHIHTYPHIYIHIYIYAYTRIYIFTYIAAAGEPIWDSGVFTIIIIFFPYWWLSYNKLFYLFTYTYTYTFTHTYIYMYIHT